MTSPLRSILRRAVRAVPGGDELLRWRLARLARRSFAAQGAASDVFRGHFETNAWGDAESVSGPGSTLGYTENIRRELPGLLDELAVRTVLDAPCGDFHWFRAIEWRRPIHYTGGDIVAPLVERNRARHGSPEREFIVLDITRDPLPAVDLWLCRDCLFHLSERDVFAVLDNFLRSQIGYLLTSDHPDCDLNHDIPTGSFRHLNLQLAPYGLGPPRRTIADWIEGHPVRNLALWRREDVASALASNRAFQRFRARRRG